LWRVLVFLSFAGTEERGKKKKKRREGGSCTPPVGEKKGSAPQASLQSASILDTKEKGKEERLFDPPYREGEGKKGESRPREKGEEIHDWCLGLDYYNLKERKKKKREAAVYYVLI